MIDDLHEWNDETLYKTHKVKTIYTLKCIKLLFIFLHFYILQLITDRKLISRCMHGLLTAQFEDFLRNLFSRY